VAFFIGYRAVSGTFRILAFSYGDIDFVDVAILAFVMST
jgi:hypothetical protein